MTALAEIQSFLGNLSAEHNPAVAAGQLWKVLSEEDREKVGLDLIREVVRAKIQMLNQAVCFQDHTQIADEILANDDDKQSASVGCREEAAKARQEYKSWQQEVERILSEIAKCLVNGNKSAAVI